MDDFKTAILAGHFFKAASDFESLFNEYVEQLSRCAVSEFLAIMRSMVTTGIYQTLIAIAARAAIQTETIVINTVALFNAIIELDCGTSGRMSGYFIKLITNFNLP